MPTPQKPAPSKIPNTKADFPAPDFGVDAADAQRRSGGGSKRRTGPMLTADDDMKELRSKFGKQGAGH